MEGRERDGNREREGEGRERDGKWGVRWRETEVDRMGGKRRKGEADRVTGGGGGYRYGRGAEREKNMNGGMSDSKEDREEGRVGWKEIGKNDFERKSNPDGRKE